MNINHQNNTSMKYFQFSTNIAVWIGIEFNLNYLPCAVFDWNAITMNVEWIFDDRNRSEPIIQKTLCKKTKKNIKCKCGIHLFINEFFYDSFTWSWQYYWESTAKLFFLLYMYFFFFALEFNLANVGMWWFCILKTLKDWWWLMPGWALGEAPAGSVPPHSNRESSRIIYRLDQWVHHCERGSSSSSIWFSAASIEFSGLKAYFKAGFSLDFATWGPTLKDDIAPWINQWFILEVFK